MLTTLADVIANFLAVVDVRTTIFYQYTLDDVVAT